MIIILFRLFYNFFFEVDVWSDRQSLQRGSDVYDFISLNENISSAATVIMDGHASTEEKLFDEDKSSRAMKAPSRDDQKRESAVTEPYSTTMSFLSSPLLLLNAYIPRFLGMHVPPRGGRVGLHRSQRRSESYMSLAVSTVRCAADLTAAQIARTFHSNVYISSFVGCVSESVIFLADRAQTTSQLYVKQLTADDPEQIHLERVRTSSKWNHIFLRYSMASLSWRERQLIVETKSDGDVAGASSARELLLQGPTSCASSSQCTADNGLHQSLAALANGEHGEAALFALEKYFTAPPFEELSACRACHKPFNLTLFRHHCRHCGRSFCDEHSKERRRIFRFGLVQPVRVCGGCSASIDEIHRRDRLIWKECRTNAYFADRLIPYFNSSVDRGIDKALRWDTGNASFLAQVTLLCLQSGGLLDHRREEHAHLELSHEDGSGDRGDPQEVQIPPSPFLSLTPYLSPYLSPPISFSLLFPLRRYGLAGFAGLLLRKDFIDSVETLKKISGMVISSTSLQCVSSLICASVRTPCSRRASTS